MAYKCVKSCYDKRLYEEREEYDDIGSANPEYFVNLEAEQSAEVVETAVTEEPEGAPLAVAEVDGPKQSTEREEIESALVELGAPVAPKTPMHVLRKRLMKAQQDALQY